MSTGGSKSSEEYSEKTQYDPDWLKGTNVKEPERNSRRKAELQSKHEKKNRQRPKSKASSVFTSQDIPISKKQDTEDGASSSLYCCDSNKPGPSVRETVSESVHESSIVTNYDISSSVEGRGEKGHLQNESRNRTTENITDTKNNNEAPECEDSLDNEEISSEESDDEPYFSESFKASLLGFEMNSAKNESSDDESIEAFGSGSMFDKSAQEINEDGGNESVKGWEYDMVLNGVSLSKTFVQKCCFQDKKNYYTENIPVEELHSLLRREPKRYKQCTLRLESAHKSICILSQPENGLREIEISGRSKCGKNFMDDDVVVEVLSNDYNADVIPRFNKRLTNNDELKVYGKVVGRLRRKRFSDIDHPVFVCELDEREYHLMRPLDKTVPKLHILTKRDQKKFQVAIYEFESGTEELRFKETININPAQKHGYVFLVVFIRWDAIYPLGAVIKAIRSDGSVNSGLKILELQYKVPTFYRDQTVQSVQDIKQRIQNEPDQNKMEDRANLVDLLSPFTIDPPNSKDLDDALSVKTLENDIKEVGVHIADVTSYIQKGDHIDEEAKDRATSFYPGQERNPYHMIPEPMSQDFCSLLPNKVRLTLSIFFHFDTNGNYIPGRTLIKKTVVKSKRQFTYKEVQDFILGSSSEEPLSNDVKTLFSIAKKIRMERLGDSMHSLPVEIGLTVSGVEEESVLETLEAHYLVEEFMILANHTIAKCICSKFEHSALLRCQDAPSSEKVQQWLKNYPRIADIVLKLQNIKPTPQRQLKVANAPVARYRVVIQMQKWIWTTLEALVKEGKFREAYRIIGCDEFHPEQALAWNEWVQFQERAEYRCLGSMSTNRESYHFTLGMSPYTHFTSPIRRYADMINHRLIHAALENKDSPYTQTEIENICFHINDACQRAKNYSKECKALQYGHVFKRSPYVLRGFIESVSDKSIHLFIPDLGNFPKPCKEIPLNLLNVSQKPQIKKDRDLDRPFDILTLGWQRRLYSHAGYAPSTKSLEPIRIDPHQQAIFQQYVRWKDIVNAMLKGDETSLKKMFSDHADYQEGDQLRSYVPACTSTVKDVSSEVRQGAITKHFCEFSMSFNHAQILSVQISAEPQKGILLPYPQIVKLSNNVHLCLQHQGDPVKYLATYSTKNVHEGNYKSISEYIDIWLPLLHMESATMAVRDVSVTVNDLPVNLKERDGDFSMTMDFIEERNIELSSTSMDFILNRKEENISDEEKSYVPNSDFLCIKCPYKDDSEACGVLKGSATEETHIWLGHGQIDKLKRIKRKRKVEVHFCLHPLSPEVPLQLLNCDVRPKCSIEILANPKSNRRSEAALLCLGKAGVLAKAVAIGSNIPDLDRDHWTLGRKMETEDDVYGLPWNNIKQQEAIQRALSNRFTLIQGPPGTGKTYTGIKLLYLFTKLNRLWHQEGNPFKQVVFCGPSNEAVDLVAKWTKKKLGELAPRIVRMYGSSHEFMDYPIPGKLYSMSSRRAKNRPDEELNDIALHHLIRQAEKPHAEEIRTFDRYFHSISSCPAISDPEQAKEFKTKLREYKALLSKAEQTELQHYEVIFCTTVMTTNPTFIKGTKNRIFQCIIDESGMCTEPESIATIVATKAEQIVMIGDNKQLRPVVMCQHAANLGLQKSLFERYATNAVFLSTQYRMNPEICEFVSTEFYDNQLKTAPSSLWKEENPLTLWKHRNVPHILCHVEGNEEYLTVSTEEGNEQSCSNKAEVEKVFSVFRRMIRKEGVNPKHINIMSQYNAQCHAIKEELLKNGYINCNVNTVVSSQGNEWDYVIFSTVRSLPGYKIEPNPTLGWCKQNLGFITDEHQIAVALSRAQKGLVIIGNKNLLKCDKVWERLLNHYGRKGCVVDVNDFPTHIKTKKTKGHR